MRVKEWRIRRRLTQDALARKAGLHRVYLAQIETGVKTPSLAMLQRLADALNIKLVDLLR